MALPNSGAISMSQVRKELGASGAISLGSSSVRKLANRTSGSISMSHLRGKSNNGFNGTIITLQIRTGSDVSGVWNHINYGSNKTLPAPYDFYDLTSMWSGDSRSRPNLVVNDSVSWQVMPRKPKMVYLQVESSPAQTTTDCHEDPSYCIISYFSKNLGGQLQEPNTFINRTIKLGFTF